MQKNPVLNLMMAYGYMKRSGGLLYETKEYINSSGQYRRVNPVL